MFTVSIDGYDAYRLASGLHMRISEFAELRWSREQDRTHRILLSPAEGKARKYWRLTLRRIPDPDPQYEKRCVFLHSINNLGRCAVYTLRPGICRTYPVFLRDSSGGVQVGGKHCPPGAWKLPVIDVRPFMPEVYLRERMTALYHQVIDTWNQRLVAASEPRREPDYFKYLIETYSDLEKQNPQQFLPGQ